MGVIPRLMTVLERDDSDAIVQACNFISMLAQAPVALTEDHIKEIGQALCPLIPNNSIPVRLSVLETINKMATCRPKANEVLLRGPLVTAVLDVTEAYDESTHISLVTPTMQVLSTIATVDDVDRVVEMLK